METGDGTGAAAAGDGLRPEASGRLEQPVVRQTWEAPRRRLALAAGAAFAVAGLVLVTALILLAQSGLGLETTGGQVGAALVITSAIVCVISVQLVRVGRSGVTLAADPEGLQFQLGRRLMVFPWASVDRVAVEHRTHDSALAVPSGFPVLAIHFTGNGYRLPRSPALLGELPTCLSILTDYVGGPPQDVAEALNAARARYGPAIEEVSAVVAATAQLVPPPTAPAAAGAPAAQPYEAELDKAVGTRTPFSWLMALILWFGAMVGGIRAVGALLEQDLGNGLAWAVLATLFAGIGLVWWIRE